jgi:hypothetical protein
MAGLAGANREIREAERREHERRASFARRPTRLADLLLARLEELNLDDVHRVPARFDPMLGQMIAALADWPGAPAHFGPRLRSGVRTATVIEAVFDIQAMLVPRPSGPPALLNDADDTLDLPGQRGWSLGGSGGTR